MKIRQAVLEPDSVQMQTHIGPGMSHFHLGLHVYVQCDQQGAPYLLHSELLITTSYLM